jgi:hypothetical protein
MKIFVFRPFKGEILEPVVTMANKVGPYLPPCSAVLASFELDVNWCAG